MKPWHVGPVPQTKDSALLAAFRAHLGEVKAAGGLGLKLSGFEKSGSCALSLRDLLKLRTLVLGLCKAQPKARFKAVQIRTVLAKLHGDDPELPWNPSGLADATWLRIVSQEIMTLMYQWRRLTSSTDLESQLKNLLSPEAAEIKQMIKSADAYSKRTLHVEKSEISKHSGVSVDSSGIPTLLQSSGDELEDDDDDEHDDDHDPARQEEDLLEEEEDEEKAVGEDEDKADRILMEAMAASSSALPPQRGGLKHMIAKKPAARAPTIDAHMGLLKLILAKEQTYILRWDQASRKWPLVVGCNWANHCEAGWLLWEMAQKRSIKLFLLF